MLTWNNYFTEGSRMVISQLSFSLRIISWYSSVRSIFPLSSLSIIIDSCGFFFIMRYYHSLLGSRLLTDLQTFLWTQCISPFLPLFLLYSHQLWQSFVYHGKSIFLWTLLVIFYMWWRCSYYSMFLTARRFCANFLSSLLSPYKSGFHSIPPSLSEDQRLRWCEGTLVVILFNPYISQVRRQA